MREILFRAKAINRDTDREYRTNYKNGDWVYGLITVPHNDTYDLPAEMRNTDGVTGIEVDYKTIGQYTGLTDKNGVKIFEGDIVEYEGKRYSINYLPHYARSRYLQALSPTFLQAWRQGFIEDKKSQDKRITEIAKHYGALLQREQFIEECSEAILAAQKCKRTPNLETIKDLQGEVADVLIMALQMRYLFGAEAVDRQIELKLARQMEQIKAEEG